MTEPEVQTILSYDVFRCLGEFHNNKCDRRETCQRYTDRDKTGSWTPFVAWLCDGQDKYIPVTGVSQ